jgi:GNAT superfamily N-acetyltransferase
MQILKPHEYSIVDTLLRSVPINTLFARAVIEGHVSGKVYVDNRHAPGVCYVAHPYGMSLLFGSTDNPRFNERLELYLRGDAPRSESEWLQVYPDDWNRKLEEMLGPGLIRVGSDNSAAPEGDRQVVQRVRVNFCFNRLRYTQRRQILVLPDNCRIINDMEYIYNNMHGSVVPKAFWDNAAQFTERSAAFALLHNDRLVTTAFAAYVIDRYLELGIETHLESRRKGFAVHACSALIDYCLNNGFEPLWACRLDNLGSYRLAQKLGFEHILSVPYYQLPGM